MRKTTDRGKKTAGAVLGAVLSALPVLLMLAFLLLPFLPWVRTLEAAEIGALLLCAVPLAAILIGVVGVLVQRIREIKGGEEDEAKKY